MEDQTPAHCAQVEGSSELGAGVVGVYRGASSSPSLEVSVAVSMLNMDPYPMLSMQDSARVQLVKLSTALSNTFVILASSLGVSSKVRQKISGWSEKYLCKFMTVQYLSLQQAGIARNKENLQMIIDLILVIWQ